MTARGALARLRAREAQRFARAHVRCAQLGSESAQHFLYGVPMHWMNDWGTPSPLFVEQARGAQLVCADGHVHADFCLADSAAMFGHAPPQLARALGTSLGNGLGAMLPGLETPRAGQLLAQRFGLPLWQCALSATDANRFCLRWARAVTGRGRILVFDGCYHGTVDDAFVDLVPGAGGAVRARASLLGQVRDLAETTRVVEFNDRAALERALADGEVACVLAEPVMTNAGMILPDEGFLQALRRACSATGTLLVLDETHTLSSGPGGYAHEHGLVPDFLVLGKSIAGGFPCAVYGFGAELGARMRLAKDEAVPGHSGIGTTLAGNLLAMGALRVLLEEVATPAAYAHMIGSAQRLEAGLQRQIGQRGLSWCLSRVGARCELQFCSSPPRTARAAHAAMDGDLQAALHLYLLNRGILITPFHNMMLCSPATQDAEIERFVEVFGEFLDELA